MFSASHFLHGNHVPDVIGQRRLLLSVAHQPNLKAVWIYLHKFSLFLAVQFSSVTQWCPTLCNPMDCSMPGLPAAAAATATAKSPSRVQLCATP